MSAIEGQPSATVTFELDDIEYSVSIGGDSLCADDEIFDQDQYDRIQEIVKSINDDGTYKNVIPGKFHDDFRNFLTFTDVFVTNEITNYIGDMLTFKPSILSLRNHLDDEYSIINVKDVSTNKPLLVKPWEDCDNFMEEGNTYCGYDCENRCYDNRQRIDTVYTRDNYLHARVFLKQLLIDSDWFSLSPLTDAQKIVLTKTERFDKDNTSRWEDSFDPNVQGFCKKEYYSSPPVFDDACRRVRFNLILVDPSIGINKCGSGTLCKTDRTKIKDFHCICDPNNNICGAHGTCINVNRTSRLRLDHFECSCDAGYYGERCDIQLPPNNCIGIKNQNHHSARCESCPPGKQGNGVQ